MPPSSRIVVTKPDEGCTREAFRSLLDELLAGPRLIWGGQALRDLPDTRGEVDAGQRGSRGR